MVNKDRRLFLSSGVSALAYTFLGSCLPSSSKLMIHNSKEREKLSYQWVGQQEGEGQLERLASQKGNIEEAWLFFPIPEKKSGIWFDIGYDQEIDEVRYERKHLLYLNRFIEHRWSKRKGTFYHIHPIDLSKYIPCKHPRGKNKYLVKISQEDIELALHPSVTDLVSSVDLEKFLDQYGYPVKQDRILIPGGKFIYCAKQRFKDLYAAGGRDEVKSLIRKAESEGKKKGIAGFLETLNKSGVDISYHRLRKLGPIPHKCKRNLFSLFNLFK